MPRAKPVAPPREQGQALRIAGTVARIIAEKGYCFLRAPDGTDYFGHYTEILNASLAQMTCGDRVTFLPTETTKGYRAVEIEWTGP